jgi:hypothetical protein
MGALSLQVVSNKWSGTPTWAEKKPEPEKRAGGRFFPLIQPVTKPKRKLYS